MKIEVKTVQPGRCESFFDYKYRNNQSYSLEALFYRPCSQLQPHRAVILPLQHLRELNKTA